MPFPVRKPHYAVPRASRPRTAHDPAPRARGRERPGPLPAALESLRPPDLRLISSIHGRITRLLLTIPSYVFEPDGEAFRGGYERLLSAMPEQTSFEIVTSAATAEAARQVVEAAGRTTKATFHEFESEIAFTMWAEDPYVVAAANGGDGPTYFVEPYEFSRRADAVIADYVAHATDLENTAAPLYFQGGNVLIGDDFFLVGIDYPANTLAAGLLRVPDGEEPLEALRGFYRKYLDPSREVYFPGSIRRAPFQRPQLARTPDGEDVLEFVYRGAGDQQPIFHIDMCISLAGRAKDGRYVALVADPREAERLLGVSYGERSLAPQFDELAASLDPEQFQVLRNPLPLAYRDLHPDEGDPLWTAEELELLTRSFYGAAFGDFVRDELAAAGVEHAIFREWYFATSNNVITEVSGGDRTVWIPEYGAGESAFPELALTDTANREIWESLGYCVVGLGDFHAFAHQLGAAHCITKYLARAE